MKLKIATCQFPVGPDIGQNLGYVLRQMTSARRRGAHVAHFSEVCLPGYAGVDIPSMRRFDWDGLQDAHRKVSELAANLKLWVIVGSAHRLSGRHKPHNSLYIIDDRGRLVDRYDKMFCTGDGRGKSGDLAHYSPGCHFSVFDIRGVRCGALICHDMRYDELYRQYKKRGVQLMFHSYHNARMKPQNYHRYNIWGTIVPPTMQTYAANNHMWISVNNSSTAESSWPSIFVQPDGTIHGRLTRNRPGVLLDDVDEKKKFYDASVAWRDRAMKGIYHSGRLVRDRRSSARTAF
jgi:predicted amidohydrolase